MKHRRYFSFLLVTLLFPFYGHAVDAKYLEEKSIRAGQVLHEVLNLSEYSIPINLLDRAVCIAVVPDVLRAGLIFGGRLGHGLVSCRVNGSWSQPSFIKMIGGSWGLQIGISSVDVVLLFVNQSAVDRLSVNNFTLGAEVSVSVGPVGRGAQAETDYQLKSEVYSYSRSRGFFGGLTIGGTSMQIDHESNAMMYKNKSTARDLLTSDGRYTPRELRSYVSSLDQNAP